MLIVGKLIYGYNAAMANEIFSWQKLVTQENSSKTVYSFDKYDSDSLRAAEEVLKKAIQEPLTQIVCQWLDDDKQIIGENVFSPSQDAQDPFRAINLVYVFHEMFEANRVFVVKQSDEIPGVN